MQRALFTVTSSAQARIQELGGLLRITLAPGGCCGTTYHFSLELRPGDTVVPAGGVRIALRPVAAKVLIGAKLDYGARLKPPRFRILNNPNTPNRCACNRSFGRPFPGKATPQCRAYDPMPWDACRDSSRK